MRKYISFFLLAALIVLLTFISIQLWSPVEDVSEVTFSVTEQEWLKAHPVITVAIDPEFAPYEFTEGEQIQGIAIEYLNYIELQYGLKFEITHADNWTDSLNALKSQEVDMLSAVARSPQRDVYTLFTESYTTIQNVVLIRQDTPADFTDKDLTSMYVAVIKDYFAQDLLELHYPGIQLYKALDISDGLRALSLGEVDAFVVDSAQASYYIPRTGANNLKMNNTISLGFDLPLHFGIRKNAPELRNILSKIIQGIPQEVHDQIQNQWSTDAFDPGIDTKLLVSIMFLGGIILLSSVLMVFWNTSLNKLVASKTADVREEIENRAIVEDQLHELIHAIPYPVSLKNYKGVYIYANRAFSDLIGLPVDKIKGQQDTTLYNLSQSINKTLMSDGDLDVLYSSETFHIDALDVLVSNEKRVFEVTKRPLKTDDVSPHGILSFFVDITDEHTSQNQLKDLNEHLEEIINDRVNEFNNRNKDLTFSLAELQSSEQSLIHLNKELQVSLDVLETTQSKLVEVEKFAAMGRASSAIAHEMNTPLGIGVSAASFSHNQIKSILNGLQEQNISKKEIVERLNQINESSELIGSNADKLILISKRLNMLTSEDWPSNSISTNMESFIRENSQLIMNNIKRKAPALSYPVDVVLDCPEAIYTNISTKALFTIFESLIWNSHLHGFVSYKSPKKINIDCYESDRALHIKYRDNGIGVNDDELTHILEPLYTSKRGSGSLGLGLSIIYNIVVLNYKGKINVSNSEKGGLTVYIQIPN